MDEVGRSSASLDPRACRFCGSPSEPFAEAPVLGRHLATYLRCPTCGSVHVPEPHWLDEAYSSAIAATDLGLAARAVRTSQATTLVIRRFFPRATKFLDFGAGNGLFVRLMRDAGFDFSWSDLHATNLFAQGFEATSAASYDLVTAFEVLEHLESPFETFAALRSQAPVILFSTLLLPDPTPRPDEWWYYTRDTGQHITFATRAGIEHLAARLGGVATCTNEIHLIASRRVAAGQLRLVTSGRVAAIAAPIARRPSLLDHDYAEALSRTRAL
jgi:hypothetical protein